jgi:hypothetical protein
MATSLRTSMLDREAAIRVAAAMRAAESELDPQRASLLEPLAMAAAQLFYLEYALKEIKAPKPLIDQAQIAASHVVMAAIVSGLRPDQVFAVARAAVCDANAAVHATAAADSAIARAANRQPSPPADPATPGA